MPNWRQSAEYYLRYVWESDDQFLLPVFSDCEVTCESLHDLCVRYRVARTVPGHIDAIGVEGKYRAFADMLNKYRKTIMTSENVPHIIDLEVEALRSAYGGRGLWSAISKALWMMKKHPVVIYDSYAWKALLKLHLRPGENTYRQYFEAWFRFFERESTMEGLDDALGWLQSLPHTQELLNAGKIGCDDLDSIWFRNRVVDLWLWSYGGGEAPTSPEKF
jgi:hypothetical protein